MIVLNSSSMTSAHQIRENTSVNTMRISGMVFAQRVGINT